MAQHAYRGSGAVVGLVAVGLMAAGLIAVVVEPGQPAGAVVAADAQVLPPGDGQLKPVSPEDMKALADVMSAPPLVVEPPSVPVVSELSGAPRPIAEPE